MRGGYPSKIDLPVEAHSLPVAFVITGGNVNRCPAAPELIAQLPSTQMILVDKGYDSARLGEQLEALGARPLIARKGNSIKGDADLDRGFIATYICSRTLLRG
jgi:IS5 family transposase